LTFTVFEIKFSTDFWFILSNKWTYGFKHLIRITIVSSESFAIHSNRRMKDSSNFLLNFSISKDKTFFLGILSQSCVGHILDIGNCLRINVVAWIWVFFFLSDQKSLLFVASFPFKHVFSFLHDVWSWKCSGEHKKLCVETCFGNETWLVVDFVFDAFCNQHLHKVKPIWFVLGCKNVVHTLFL
jgi:hypothetical protein